MRVRLHELAHGRAGDKGNTSTMSLIPYRPENFALLAAQVTPSRVKEHFAGLVTGEVERWELPHLPALHYVMNGALSGGVTRSLALDAHGKTLSFAFLALEIDLPEGTPLR